MQTKFMIVAALALLVLPALSVGDASLPGPFYANGVFNPEPIAPLASDASVTASRVSFSGEPVVLVDQAGKWVWVGDFEGVHRSTNGVKWATTKPAQAPGGFIDGFALAQDAFDGALYASSTTGQWIAVDKSTDGGISWTQVNRFASIGLPFADRPWIVTGPAPNEVTLVYNGNGGEGCMHSTDGGVTFLPGSTGDVPPNAGNVARDDFGNTYYALDTTIFMWAGPNACPVHMPGQPFAARKALPPSGAQILTQLAVPAGTGTNANGGHVYVAVPTAGNGEMVIRATASMRTTAPDPIKTIVVSDATMKSNTFGAIAVKPDDSEIAVSWYASNMAGDPSASTYPATATWNVYVARITNIWSATPTVTTQLVEAGNYHGWYCMNGVTCTSGRDLADYHGVTYGPDGKLHVVWGTETGANGSGQVEVRYANLG